MSAPTALTIAQVSETTGIPVPTLRYWRACGRGPKSFNLGRAVRYDVRDLDAWMNAQRAHAVGDDL